MKRSQTKRSNFNLRNYIIASIALHFLFVAITETLSALHKMGRLDSQNQAIEVVLEEKDLSEKNQDLNKQPKQIVETDSNSANNQVDDQAKYNSEKSNTVEKETKAKTGEVFKNSLKNGALTASSKKSAKNSAKAQANANTVDLLNPAFDPYSVLVRKEAQQKEAVQKNAEQAGGVQAGDTSTTNDSLNVNEDLITRLNTKEYKYYGYYHRIKNQLNQWWQPKVREKVTKMVNQGRTIASEENKVTRLVIILNDAGNLVKIQVLAESGVRDLDDAAIEAFRSAAPFPNPPKGIIENDGTVRIRWDFVVES